MPMLTLSRLFSLLLLLLAWPLCFQYWKQRLESVPDDVPLVMIDWQSPDVVVTPTLATLQVVTNPILNKQTSPIAQKLFGLLHHLNADLVRYVPWFPYPLVGVAELEPPNCPYTSWNFSTTLQQEFLNTFHAVTSNANKRVVINFSTQPTWMFETDSWDYSTHPNRVNWHYARGKVGPKTISLVAKYYGRLASWMANGHFIDECGHNITGGPALGITHWEVFNEPEREHGLSPSQYNTLFDAVVRAVRSAVGHDIQFMGPALSGHYEWDWYTAFLNPQNHAADVRDAVQDGMVTFHWYAHATSRTNSTAWMAAFDEIPVFLKEVDQIIALRNQFSPTTGLNVNEAGVIPMNDNTVGVDPLPPLYFNMAAAVYTILVAQLSVKKVNVVGSSQFVGCTENPAWSIWERQYPGVSMTNWTSGNGNPRYWALKLYLQYFGPGDRIVPVRSAGDNDSIFIQARLTVHEKKAILLVNKSDQVQTIHLSHIVGAKVNIVDDTTHDGPWKETYSQSPLLCLRPFAIAIVETKDIHVDYL